MKKRTETRITVRFPSALVEELRIYKEQDDRSLNAEIVQAVREFLARRRTRRGSPTEEQS